MTEGGLRLELALAPRGERRPPWCDILQPAFSTSLGSITASSVSAVLLVQPSAAATPAFAIVFGAGRYLLDPDALEPNFGLRVALNAISGPSPETATWSPERIRSVAATRVASNTMLTRRQASRRTAFEEFGVDVQRDLIRSVTGVPVDGEWGGRISGSDMCHISRPVSLTNLAEVCERLEALFRDGHYRQHFSWVDHVRHVANGRIRQRLDDALVLSLRAPDGALGDRVTLELAPPGFIEWDNIEAFSFGDRPDTLLDDISLADFRQMLKDEDRLAALDAEDLKRHTIIANLSTGDPLRWSVYRCLSGEIRLGDDTYLLDGGQYYEIGQDYLSDLDAFVMQIPHRQDPMPCWRGHLPPPLNRQEREEDYNDYATGVLGAGICLDRKTIRIDSRTTAVEICDILTANGELIHVKPKHNSSVLSHLFAQGAVSADLLLKNERFRALALQQIDEAIGRRAAALGPVFAERIRGLLASPLDPKRLRVVYAIGGNWKGRSLCNMLPFFSKVNLRAHVEDLRAMGYAVEYAAIDGTQNSGAAAQPRRRRREATTAVPQSN